MEKVEHKEESRGVMGEMPGEPQGNKREVSSEVIWEAQADVKYSHNIASTH